MKHLSLASLGVAVLLMGAGCDTTANTAMNPALPPVPGPNSNAAGTQLEGTPAVNDTPDAKVMAPVRAEDSVYVIDGEPVTFREGKFFTDTPGTGAQPDIHFFGPLATGDLNGDGTPDAAVIIVKDAGGSGTFYYVAAALNYGGEYRGTSAIKIGDRIAPQNIAITDGMITANYADRKPGQPMTAKPSVGVSKNFRVVNNELTEVPAETGSTSGAPAAGGAGAPSPSPAPAPAPTSGGSGGAAPY